ncbi:hypothetical protein E2C01_035973 [Portunus trituberculatus]|uniref:Uncharacterized protein n=1 Tax=Portunus trituberculatus TaxID=210409 RepID=A0A5B7F5Q1_PORTR|nr:hypothetical protein [Portunus trituberculatus]
MYSIPLGGGGDGGEESLGVMVIKSKDKTKAKQRKGALSNWKSAPLAASLKHFALCCFHCCPRHALHGIRRPEADAPVCIVTLQALRTLTNCMSAV